MDATYNNDDILAGESRLFLFIERTMKELRKPNLLDKLAYKLFFYRWSPFFEEYEEWREDVKKKIDWLGEPAPDIKEKKKDI